MVWRACRRCTRVPPVTASGRVDRSVSSDPTDATTTDATSGNSPNDGAKDIAVRPGCGPRFVPGCSVLLQAPSVAASCFSRI